jgi:transposase
MQAERRYAEYGDTLREDMPMPKPLSDDLRCRILDAYEQKEGSQSKLAARFGVSFDYVHKILRHWRRSGKRGACPSPGMAVRAG